MSARPEMLLERCQKKNNKAFYISSNCKDHGSAAWYSVQPVIPLKSTQSVWLDTVLRQKHILKVRRRKTFISRFLCNIKKSSFRSLRCISLCIDEEKKSALLFLHLKAKQGKINSLAERLDIHWMNFLLPPPPPVYSVSCSEDKISHHFLAMEQSDTALQCLQLTLVALSSPPSIWESEQSCGGWHDCL